MKNNFLFFVILIILSGCQSLQPDKTIKTKTKTNTERRIKRTIKELPKEKIIYKTDTVYKDTTIVVKGKVIKMKLNYKNKKLKQAECEAPGGKETEENIQENIQEQKKQTEQTEYVDKKTFFIYGMGFAFFIMLILLLKK